MPENRFISTEELHESIVEGMYLSIGLPIGRAMPENINPQYIFDTWNKYDTMQGAIENTKPDNTVVLREGNIYLV